MSAAGRRFGITFRSLRENEIRPPTASVGIGRPNFVLHRVTTRFIGLDVDRIAARPKACNRGVDGLGRFNDDAVVGAFANVRFGVEVEGELETGLLREKERVVG